jgi:uncharacterized SAM-binding protein YcdF (DUF218 family)
LFLLVRLAIKAVTVLLVLVALYAGFTFLQVWHASHQDEPQPAEAVIVLGAAQYNGRPSPVLQARLDRAAELYRAGLAPVVVVTGGQRPGDRFTEAGAGQRYLVARGVPADALRLEVQGRNSWESLAAAQRFLARESIDDVLLVSDAYHSFRVAETARELGLHPRVAPARPGGAPARELWRETLAVGIGRMIGYRRLTNLDRAHRGRGRDERQPAGALSTTTAMSSRGRPRWYATTSSTTAAAMSPAPSAQWRPSRRRRRSSP